MSARVTDLAAHCCPMVPVRRPISSLLGRQLSTSPAVQREAARKPEQALSAEARPEEPLKVPVGFYLHKPRFDAFISSLKKLNPSIEPLTKSHADKAMAVLFSNVTKISVKRIEQEMRENRMQRQIGGRHNKWRLCHELYKESERWWKEKS